MNTEINVNLITLTDRISALEKSISTIDEYYAEKVSITSYEGSKKEEIEEAINKYLDDAKNSIHAILESIVSELKLINELYTQDYYDNQKVVE